MRPTQGLSRHRDSPFLGDLVLPLHLLLLELSDVPHADLLAELHEHLVFHLESRAMAGSGPTMQEEPQEWS